MEEPIRILHVLGSLNIGGAESRIMDLYRSCDRTRIQFDFAIHTAAHTYYETEAENLGGRIYRLPRFRFWNYFSYCRAWKRLFQEHPEFTAVHGHMTSTASIYLPIAKKAGIPLTIAHARSAGVDRGPKGWLTRLLRKNLGKKADCCLACSDLAAEAVFGKTMTKQGKVWILPNTIRAGLYRYREEERNRMRKELGVEDSFVVGHVGRFHPCKNHLYLLEIFEQLHKRKPEAKLVLLGEGEQMEHIREMAKEKQLQEQVLFLGNHTDIQKYYQAFDSFVFPSFYEGMPGSVVEAQASGLPCFVSDRITREVAFTDLVSFLDIGLPASAWAEKILERGENTRRDYYEQVVAAGFDAGRQAELLQQFYCTGKFQQASEGLKA